MPTINLSESSFAKLKTIAEPLVDTLETVIDRVIDEAVARRRDAAIGRSAMESPVLEGALQLDPDSPPSLTFTRVRSARVEGSDLHRPKWSSVMVHMHRLALAKLGSVDRLAAVSGARLRAGRHESDGFKYDPRGDFSIQGVEANLCWSHSLRLAREIGVELEVVLEWREKADPARRGKIAVLRWSPTVAGRRPRGLAKGQIKIAKDFDAPLPEEILKEFE